MALDNRIEGRCRGDDGRYCCAMRIFNGGVGRGGGWNVAAYVDWGCGSDVGGKSGSGFLGDVCFIIFW